MITKYCHKCKLDKALDQFTNDPRGRMGRDNCCKECRALSFRTKRAENPELRRRDRDYMKKWHQKNDVFVKYGITNEQLAEMVAVQGNRCALCGSDNPKAPRWCIDHDHQSNKIRGLLCHSCNTALGGYEKMMKISGHIRLENYINGINPHDCLVY